MSLGKHKRATETEEHYQERLAMIEYLEARPGYVSAPPPRKLNGLMADSWQRPPKEKIFFTVAELIQMFLGRKSDIIKATIGGFSQKNLKNKHGICELDENGRAIETFWIEDVKRFLDLNKNANL